MQLASALLCDAASVREGLLFILGGGITRLWRQEFPAGFGCSLALVVELHQMEMPSPHEIEVLIQGEDGQEIAKAEGGFQAGAEGMTVGETLLVPLVLDLHQLPIPSTGVYAVNISIDGAHQRTLTVRARPADEKPTSQAP